MRVIAATLSLILALAGGVALGAYFYGASAPARVEVATTLTAGLVLDPPNLDFAGLPPGQQSAIRHIRVTNAGDATLRTLTILPRGLPQGISLLSSQTPTTPIAPGVAWDVYLQLAATSTVPAGVYQFTLEFRAE